MQVHTTQTLQGGEPAPAPDARETREWPMHARSVGELLDLAVDLFVARMLPAVGLAFLLWLPVRSVWVLLGSGAWADESAQWLFGVFANSCVQALSVALVLQVIYAELQGRRLGAGRALIVALRRSPALLLSTTLVAIGTSLGMFCCLVPGIYLTFLWSAAPAALVLEGSGPIASLRRSQQLVGKQFLRWLGLTVCALLIKLPYDGIVIWLDQPSTLEWALDAGIPAGGFALAQVVVSSLLFAISTAAWAIVATVFYLDCRVRSEGFDLAMRLERLQAAHAGGR